MIKAFLLDNHDSFTYNLASLLRDNKHVKLTIITPEKIDIASIALYDKIVFSPGPGLPVEYPIMCDILDAYKETKSILGVCLGHQMIGEYFGAKLANLEQVSHGMIKKLHITHSRYGFYTGIPDQSEIGVYHSWYVSKDDFPDCLSVTAESNDRLIMSLEHKQFDIQSVQFHPESFITQHGRLMIDNWLNV